MSFPEGFLWGAATSAYQIEGAAHEDGRGESIWDRFARTPGKVKNGENGDVACDHYHRFPEDLDLVVELGLKAYSFSIAWPRLFPDGDARREPRGFAFYDRLLDAMHERGITPMATLYHWDLPQKLQDQGGWTKRMIVDRFAEYAAACGDAFGDRVQIWTPINEPWCVSWLSHFGGIHAPGIRDYASAVAAAHHTVMAHSAATRALRSTAPDPKVGPVLNIYNFPPDDPNDPSQSRASTLLDGVHNLWWWGAHLEEKYPQAMVDHYGEHFAAVYQEGDLAGASDNDWLGINYYGDIRVGPPLAETRTIAEADCYPIDERVDLSSRGELTDMGWQITPDGLESILKRLHRLYPDVPPITITENGAAYDYPVVNGRVHDEKRIAYYRGHLLAIKSAIAAGVPVEGYCAWSLMDNFEWAQGYDKRFGIIHVDFQTQQRTIKDSGYFYRDVVKSNGANL